MARRRTAEQCGDAAQRGRGEGKVSFWTASSPGICGARRQGVGRPEATALRRNGGGRKRRRPERRRRFERPRNDSSDQRVENGEAESLMRFDLPCEAPIDGGERRAAATVELGRETRERGGSRGAGGERREGVVGVVSSLTTHGRGPRRHGASAGAAGTRGSGRSVAIGEEEGHFAGSPLAFSLFCFSLFF